MAGSGSSRPTASRAGRLDRRRTTARSLRRAPSRPRTVAKTTTSSPRVGFAYDLTGDNRTVSEGFFGQFRLNSADTLADQENPGRSSARCAIAWHGPERQPAPGCDPAEIGAVRAVGRRAAPASSRVDRNLKRPTSNEVSTSLEREIITRALGTRVLRLQEYAGRLGRRRSQPRADLHRAVHVRRSGPDSVARHGGRSDVAICSIARRTSPEHRVYTNPTGTRTTPISTPSSSR